MKTYFRSRKDLERKTGIEMAMIEIGIERIEKQRRVGNGIEIGKGTKSEAERRRGIGIKTKNGFETKGKIGRRNVGGKRIKTRMGP